MRHQTQKTGDSRRYALFHSVCAIVRLPELSANFNDFRIFWWIGYILGGIIYLKSLHKIIAFFENVCYNKVTKLVKKAKNQEKALKKRRIKQV